MRESINWRTISMIWNTSSKVKITRYKKKSQLDVIFFNCAANYFAFYYLFFYNILLQIHFVTFLTCSTRYFLFISARKKQFFISSFLDLRNVTKCRSIFVIAYSSACFFIFHFYTDNSSTFHEPEFLKL